MRLNAGHVEDQYLGVELNVGEDVERQGDYGSDLGSTVSQPSESRASAPLVQKESHRSKHHRGHLWSPQIEDVPQEHFRVQLPAGRAIERRILCGAFSYVV